MPGPSLAQARFLEIWEPGHLESWNPKIPKNKIIKDKIRHAQNVGKVWISRKEILVAPFGTISGNVFHGSEKCKMFICLLPVFLGGPMAADILCDQSLNCSEGSWLPAT